jgi:hypothetical protein
MYSCETVSPFAFADGTAYGPDLMRIAEGSYVPDIDRRQIGRLPLELKIYLLRSTDAYPLESRTTNVNCHGFYCKVPEPFLVGECFHCTIAIPAVGPRRGEDYLMLQCEATVIRIDLHESQYGLGCRINNYTILPAR